MCRGLCVFSPASLSGRAVPGTFLCYLELQYRYQEGSLGCANESPYRQDAREYVVMIDTGELFPPVIRELPAALDLGPVGPVGSAEPVQQEPRARKEHDPAAYGPPAGPAGAWSAAVHAEQPVPHVPHALSVMPIAAIPAARTPLDDRLDSCAVPASAGHAIPADRVDVEFSEDSRAAGYQAAAGHLPVAGQLPTVGYPPPLGSVAAVSSPTSDRRQFHLYAGAAMVGALLPDGQSMDPVDGRGTTSAQAVVAHAEQQLAGLLATHEHTPPAHVVAQTVRLRRCLDQLAQRPLTASDARRLRIVAGRATVLHADAAFKLGDPDAARALAATGFAAGEWAGDGPLQGSAREIGAVAEFYGGRPDVALQLARDGLRYVSAGPVRARLVCQEARALAALGDVRGAARALDLAYDLADMIPVEQWGSPGPGFDTFHPVEVAYNATTALCLLGRSRAAEEHAQLAMPQLDAMNAPGFRSVIRLDLALALARQGRLELDRVCALATEAISISWGRTVASASNRADQLLAITRTHGEVRDVRELAAYVRGWQREGGRQLAGSDEAGVGTKAAAAMSTGASSVAGSREAAVEIEW